MFRNSLDKKPIITKEDGNQIRDITESMFDFRTNNYENFTVYRVPKDFAMRPDLISQAVYNNTVYAEFILKYNGISNPFSIAPDDVILIPDLDTAKLNTKKRTSDGAGERENRIRNYYKYIDPTKAPKRSEQLEEFNKRKIKRPSSGRGDDIRRGAEDTEEGMLPPNIAQPGESQITQRNGRIYFGENVSDSAARKKPCLKNGMSSSEFLGKVVKSRKV